MRKGQRWGLGLTAAIHALLWIVFVRGIAPAHAPQSKPGSVMTVALMAPPAPAPAAPAPAQPQPQPQQTPPAAPPDTASAAVREELHYYYPQELERQLVVLRDQSGDVEIDLHEELVINLFVDVLGHVVAITYDDAPPAPALQAQVRKAFMSMEFMPGLKQGQPVPSRMKIGIAPLITLPAPGTSELK
ncbi:MAG: hypothetical protein V4484_01550 [Pseudomonadota bacterium]